MDGISIAGMHGLTIDHLRRLKEPLVIYSRGVPMAVIMTCQQYEKLVAQSAIEEQKKKP